VCVCVCVCVKRKIQGVFERVRESWRVVGEFEGEWVRVSDCVRVGMCEEVRACMLVCVHE
jgi:hypothetical protein